MQLCGLSFSLNLLDYKDKFINAADCAFEEDIDVWIVAP